MGRQKIRMLTPKSWVIFLSAILLFVIIATYMTYHFIRPMPPDKLVMATGIPGGTFSAFGELYRQILARNGIHLVLRATSGAVENLRLLKNESGNVDVGFVQGITGRITEKSNLVSLGSLAYTPLWIFYKGDADLDDLSQLKGKKIAIGPEGSGVRNLSLDLLKKAGISGPPTVLHEVQFPIAKSELIGGKLDAIMTFASTDNQIIEELLHAKGIKLMSLSQAEAYTRYFPDLSHSASQGHYQPGEKVSAIRCSSFISNDQSYRSQGLASRTGLSPTEGVR